LFLFCFNFTCLFSCQHQSPMSLFCTRVHAIQSQNVTALVNKHTFVHHPVHHLTAPCSITVETPHLTTRVSQTSLPDHRGSYQCTGPPLMPLHSVFYHPHLSYRCLFLPTWRASSC
jgi:hypothetical protein